MIRKIIILMSIAAVILISGCVQTQITPEQSCTYETANLFTSGGWFDDFGYSESKVNEKCERECSKQNLLVGEPERKYDGMVWTWDCHCYQCDEEVTNLGFEKCWFDVWPREEQYKMCMYPNGTRVGFGIWEEYYRRG